MIFGKKVIERKMPVLIFATTFALNISHSKNPARYHKCTWVFVQGTHYCCQILMQHEFS
jgi:hypothetical protein